MIKGKLSSELTSSFRQMYLNLKLTVSHSDKRFMEVWIILTWNKSSTVKQLLIGKQVSQHENNYTLTRRLATVCSDRKTCSKKRFKQTRSRTSNGRRLFGVGVGVLSKFTFCHLRVCDMSHSGVSTLFDFNSDRIIIERSGTKQSSKRGFRRNN